MRTIHARLAPIQFVPMLAAILLAAPLASAQELSRQVIDDVGFWSPAAKARANLKITEIKRLFNKDLVIEAAAAPKLPGLVDANDKHAVDDFYNRWAQQRYEQLKVEGVYVAVVPTAHKIRYELGKATQKEHFFTHDDGQALVGRVSPLLAKNPDEALAEVVQFVEGRMKENHAASPIGGQPQHRAGQAGQAGHGRGSDWSGVWTIVGFAIVAWIVFAVIRGIMGMSRGGQQGYPGGGYGGGGGGFFSNMLGGLFGAAAGMYLYNSFFGHGNSAWGAGGGDYGSGSDPNAGDATATGGGGDYGDAGDANGGGGGGGDWGGGDGGAGGGGDWGGGGGDFGGGGGDWGGGGGDFGGGGGGGDW